MSLCFCNNRYQARRDNHGWRMTSYAESTDKDGAFRWKTTETYHANIRQVVEAVIDREAGHCADVEQLKQLLQSAYTMLDMVTPTQQ